MPQTKMKPIISVIVPCYNLSKYLQETLDSMLKQTYQNWECIIIDDGSTDDTASVALKYTEQDPRFIYLYKENEGVCIAKNYAIKRSQGKYILPLDADDLIAPHYIEEAIVFLDKNPEVRLVYCDGVFFGEKSGPILNADYSYELLLYTNLIHNSSIYYREDFDRIGGYDPKMHGGLEDWEFWISLLENEEKVYKIPRKYFFYRIRTNSRSIFLHNNLRDIIYNKHKNTYLKYWGTPFELYNYKREYIGLTNLKSFKLWKKIYDAIFSKRMKNY